MLILLCLSHNARARIAPQIGEKAMSQMTRSANTFPAMTSPRATDFSVCMVSPSGSVDGSGPLQVYLWLAQPDKSPVKVIGRYAKGGGAPFIAPLLTGRLSAKVHSSAH